MSPIAYDPIMLAVREGNSLRKIKWTIKLLEQSIEFSRDDSRKNRSFTIPKEKAHSQLKIANKRWLGYNLQAQVSIWESYRFILGDDDLPYLKDWLPELSRSDLRKILNRAGVILTVLSIIHMALPGILSSFFGVLLLGLGILNLVYTHRNMYIINGIMLVVVGVYNMIVGTGIGWFLFGIYQIILGIIEAQRYKKFPAEFPTNQEAI